MNVFDYESALGYEDPKISSGVRPLATNSGSEISHRFVRMLPPSHVPNMVIREVVAPPELDNSSK